MRLDDTTGAKLVLASDLELRAYTLLKFKLKQPRFKTQVPLLPLSTTLDIANELGVLHPRDWKTNSAKTMSTDIVVEGIDRETGEEREIAAFVRYMDGLYKVVNGERRPIKREWEKIEIARIYETEVKGREYIIMTDEQLPKPVEYSINWLTYYKDHNYCEADLIGFAKVLLHAFFENEYEILEDILEITADKITKPFKECLNLFRYCGARQYLPLDLSHRITLSSTIRMDFDEII